MKVTHKFEIYLLIICLPALLLGSCTMKDGEGPLTGQDKIVPPAQVLDLQNSFIRVAESVKPSVVNISATRVEKSSFSFKFRSPFGEDPFEEFFKYFFPQEPDERKLRSVGTGVIIDAGGYILTNYHVVEGAKDIQVAISDGKDRKTFAGRLVGKDGQIDLAVVKIDGKPLKGFRFPVARLGDSDRIRVGEWAVAIGSPFGLEHTVTVGVISAKRQNVSVEGRNYADLIQTDASINPGNSGGPLVNVYGEVIGINVAIFTPSGGFVGVGFAIPINKAKEVLADLITRGGVERGWLGIKIQELNPDLAKAFKLSKQEGAVVSEILQGSPAQEGGMKNGDVITGFNGYAVKNTGDLHQMVSKAKPGTVANIDVIREGKKQNISVKIGRVPQEEQDLAPAGSEEKISLRILGLTLQNHSEGVLVAGVESGSIAENAGILEGDVIKEINKAAVRNIQDLQKAVKGAGKNILFLIKRGDATVYIAMNAE